MTQPISPSSSIYFSNIELRETASRRKWISALTEIKDLFDPLSLSDSLSLALKDWFHQFRDQLNPPSSIEPHPDVEEVASRFLTTLDSLLTDSLFQTPLTEDALLGSDGETYLPQSIQRFWNIVSTSLTEAHLSQTNIPNHLKNLIQTAQNRSLLDLPPYSPLHLDDASYFSTQIHPVVPSLIRWKNAHQSQTQLSRIDALFQEQAQLENDIYADLRDLEEEINRFGREELSQIDQGFASLQEEIEDSFLEHHKELDTIEQRDEEAYQSLKKGLEMSTARQEKLKNEMEQLKEDEIRLKNKETQTETAVRNLQISITACAAAAAKRKSSSLKAFAITCGILIGCGAVSLLVQAATGAPIAIAPMKSGIGATFNPMTRGGGSTLVDTLLRTRMPI